MTPNSLPGVGVAGKDEEWRPVPGFPGYEVSDEGRVASYLRRNRLVLALMVKSNGYVSVNLARSRRRVTCTVHSLVAEAFIGPRPPGQEVRHLDGDPHNNRVSNLRWGTRSQNELDKVRHGTHHNARKTHCPAGHPYGPRRRCSPCDNAAQRVRRAAAA